MTSASVLSSDRTNSKASSILHVAVPNSNVAGQTTAAAPSLSCVSMSSSKASLSSTLAISSSSFEALSISMAKKLSTPSLPLALSKLVISTVVVSTSDVPSSALFRSDSSSVTMSSSLITKQGTSYLPSVYSLLVSSSSFSPSSLPRGRLLSNVVSTSLAIDKSTPETPSGSSMLLASSTMVSQQLGTLFSESHRDKTNILSVEPPCATTSRNWSSPPPAIKVSVKENEVPTEKNSSRASIFATKASYISH